MIINRIADGFRGMIYATSLKKIYITGFCEPRISYYFVFFLNVLTKLPITKLMGKGFKAVGRFGLLIPIENIFYLNRKQKSASEVFISKK